MKRFKDLNSSQKRTAIDHVYRRELNEINWNGAGQPQNIKDRLKEIEVKIKFCGCTDCDLKLFAEIQKDSVIKETILDRARTIAEGAWYPEDDDTLITVK